LYLIGEFVRDLLLEKPNKKIDLLAIGNKEFFSVLEKKWQGCLNEESASFSFSNGYSLHIKLAKREFKEFPGENSELLTVVKHALYSYDFTVNTLAVSLNKVNFGYLIDFYDGQNDLLKKQLRVLHNFSFAENPLRMLRIISLAQNTGFSLEKQTRLLLENAVKEFVLQKVKREDLIEETEKCLKMSTNKELLWQRFNDLGLAEQLTVLLGKECLNKILSPAVS
jgi:tRNA nucleotidyltransferase (CCA-adding enzyme)